MGSICQLKLKLEEIIDKQRQGSCSVLTVILPRKQFCAVVTESKVTFGKLYMLFYFLNCNESTIQEMMRFSVRDRLLRNKEKKNTFFFFVWGCELKSKTKPFKICYSSVPGPGPACGLAGDWESGSYRDVCSAGVAATVHPRRPHPSVATGA